MLMWLMSDRALPRSYRMMQGFGVHTFRLRQRRGPRHVREVPLEARLGTHSLVWDEAQKIAGKDPDFNRRDLWEAIEAGDFPEWELGVQLVPEERRARLRLRPARRRPSSSPRSWCRCAPVGRMVLNRNPDNFFAETEQVAFHTAQRRARHRLHQRPAAAGPAVLVPRHPADPPRRPELRPAPDQPAGRRRCTTTSRTASHQQRDPTGRRQLPPELARRRLPGARHGDAGRLPALHRSGSTARRSARAAPSFADHYSQATLFWNSMSAYEQQHIVDAFAFELGKVEPAGDPPARRRADPREHRRAPDGARSPPSSAWRRRPRPPRTTARTLAGARAWPTSPGGRHPQGRGPRRRRRGGVVAAGGARAAAGRGRRSSRSSRRTRAS